MSKTHLTRKELKEDEFMDAGRSFFHYIEEHKHAIITGILAVLALILLVVAVFSYNSRKTTNANKLKYEGIRLFQEGLYEMDMAKQKQSFDAAAEVFADLEANYGSMKVAEDAGYLRANCLLLMQDFDGAVAAYEEFIQKSRSSEDKAMAQVGIGYAIENKAFMQNDDHAVLQKALEAYKKAEELGVDENGSRTYLAYQAKLARGRVLNQLGQNDKAIAVLEEVKEERPYFEQNLDEISDGSWQQFMNMDRDEKSKLMRRTLLEYKGASSFEQRAEELIERIKAETGKKEVESGKEPEAETRQEKAEKETE